MSKSHIQRVKSYQRHLPDKYKEPFWELTGDGHDPRCVRAAIEYIETEKTQNDIEYEYDVSHQSIRTHARNLVDMGVVTVSYIQANNRNDGLQLFADERRELAWEPPQ